MHVSAMRVHHVIRNEMKCQDLCVSNVLFVTRSKISNAFDIVLIRDNLSTVCGNESSLPNKAIKRLHLGSGHYL